MTVDRSTQEAPVALSDAYTQELQPPTVDAGTQGSPSREDQVITDSPAGQQASPPKRHKRDEPPPAPPTFTEPLEDQTVQEGVRHTLQAR